MAQKIVSLPGIGEVILAKRRGTRNLRLSIAADGRIRVGMPYWAPYQTGISFVLSRADWINKHAPAAGVPLLSDGMHIGKSFRLSFITDSTAVSPRSRIAGSRIIIKSRQPANDCAVQKTAVLACERALKKDAENLLPIRLRQLAIANGFEYESLRIKRLRSRWGSCSSQKEITLNYYLVQLPWPLIDYVILHELAHTRHLHHGPDFWQAMRSLLPDVKQLRKDIKQHRPALAPPALA
jgi:predicted metal-dependent hydrolase